jgi:4-amino-4-deoxy-L-arabinose transferase-like glycosyltransferase
MPNKHSRLRVGLFLAATLVFAVLGQAYFFWKREYTWDAALFFALALGCFLFSLRAQRSRRGARPQAAPARPWFDRLGEHLRSGRSLTIGLAVLLSWAAARSANTQPPPDDFSFSVGLWLASLALLFGAFIPWQGLNSRFQGGSVVSPTLSLSAPSINRRTAAEAGLVLGLVLAGFVVRAWDLEQIPANLSGDEGTQGMWAVDALTGRLRNPFATGWFTVPTLSFFAQAGSLRLFGDSVAGLRMLSALVGTATLAFTFLLARRILGRRIALIALATLTFSHYHIHFSRLGSNQIGDPLFMTLALWLLTEALRRTSTRETAVVVPPGVPLNTAGPVHHTRLASGHAQLWFLATGFVLGLSWYGYFGSRVIALVVAVYLALEALRKKDFWKQSGRSIALMVLMAILTISPLLLYYARYPENLSARFNQVSFFHWLNNELQRPDHASTISLVLRQVWRSVSAFNYTLDPTFWYHAQIPLLDFVSGIFFVLGLAVAIRRWWRPGVQLLLLWFGLALTMGWILTENPPSSMRMVIIAPAIAMLVALGLDRVLGLARWAVGGSRAEWNRVGLGVLAVAATLNVQFYFFDYTPSRVFGNPTAETATVLARHLEETTWPNANASQTRATQPPDGSPFVYFYGPPFLYYDFGTIRFIARDVPGMSVPPRDEDPDFLTPVTGPTIFVVLSERLEELATIQAQHPNGKSTEFRSEADGRLMFTVYEVRP